MVRFFQSRNVYFDDPRDTVDRNGWYSRNEINEFRAQFNYERKWMIAIDSIIAADGTNRSNFCGVLTNVYGNILKRHAVTTTGTLDISYPHCRKLSNWLAIDASRSGLEKLLVPHVTTDILAGRKHHRDTILELQSRVSVDTLREQSIALSTVDRVFVQTTAVALAMAEHHHKQGTFQRLVRSTSRVVRK